MSVGTSCLEGLATVGLAEGAELPSKLYQALLLEPLQLVREQIFGIVLEDHLQLQITKYVFKGGRVPLRFFSSLHRLLPFSLEGIKYTLNGQHQHSSSTPVS